MKKKLFLGLVLVFGLFLATGCGNKVENLTASLEDIMTQAYGDIPAEELPMMLSNIEVTEELEEGFLGTTEIEYKEALASESMVGSIAHSVVLVRLADDATAEEIEDTKQKIKENINPRKWVCVEVQEENVIVDNKGNTIILIMSDEHAKTIQTNFQNIENK